MPATVELELWLHGRYRLVRPSRKLGVKNGSHFWRAKVPANGRARLTYVVEREPEPPPSDEDEDEDRSESDR
jgi:hypothetical protein